MSRAQEIGSLALAEANDSVAYSLLGELLRTRTVTDEDADFLKQRYYKLCEVWMGLKLSDQDVTKKLKVVTNEILSEKILYEKSVLEEAEETSKLRKMEENRNSLQKELEYTEQRETVAKFELNELKKIHDELTNALEALHKQNHDLVVPVLTKYKEDITSLTNECAEMEVIYEKETIQKNSLSATLDQLEQVQADKNAILSKSKEILASASVEPSRVARQIEAIVKAVETLEEELRILRRREKQMDADVEKQAQKREDAKKLKDSLLEKLELKRQTIEQREQDVAIVKSNLEGVKAFNNDLTVAKLESNANKKECDSQLRHNIDQLSFCKKDYDNVKRQLRKKQVIVNSIKQILPTLEGQLSDEEAMLITYKEDRDRKQKELNKLKEEVDVLMAYFLQQEGVEADKKQELEKVLAEVDELEGEVVSHMAESKRQSKLLQVLSAQRDIISRESARIVQNEKDARQHVIIKELSVLDLTKRCNEVANRIKEFTALYDIVKNERNKYVNLIQISVQSLAEMKEKIRILNNEVEILSNESSAKDFALSKERTAHTQACSHRDSLRQDMNRLLSEYRSKQSSVEQQMQEIDKLNVVINNLEKDMIDIKKQYERAVEERNMIGVQLIDRNDELCILYERNNQQQEANKKGEMTLIKLEEELRLVRLQTEELKRQYNAARKRLPELDVNRNKITQLEAELVEERKRTEELSIQLEDPQNVDRWRPLEGEDPDMEQLASKIKILEHRLDLKREQLLEKELIFEEVSALSERLRVQALNKRDGAKLLADELNDLQHRITMTTKKMLASVSELSMYQATALRLQQEKSQREKLLDDAKWKLDHGEAPNEEAVKDWTRKERKKAAQAESSIRRQEEMQNAQMAHMVKTAALPRPTAYIPDDTGLPKPYGGNAPFKPTEAGANMRHIKNPVIKPIEI